jgi:N-acetylmuramoyl-L-alanine amidase
MATPVTPSSSQTAPHNKPRSVSRTTQDRPFRGTLYYLQIVIVVALSLATLFTAWTEPGLLPDSLAEKLNQAILLQDSTPLPNLPTFTPRPHPRIGIVAGHWGNDSGAVCQQDGLREVDINLEVATRVKESLAGEGFDVDLLKEFDPRLTGYAALLLVSIHTDSCEYINDQATGYKVSASMSTKYPEKASHLTTCLRVKYAETTGLSFHPGSVTPDMTSYHAFDEIDPNTTAAIVEVGFMNLDRNFLTKNPDLVANGITRGILCYVRNEDLSPGSDAEAPAEP